MGAIDQSILASMAKGSKAPAPTQIAAQQRKVNLPGIAQKRMALPGQQLAANELVGGRPNIYTRPAYMSNQSKPAEKLTQKGIPGLQYNTMGGGANRFGGMPMMGRPFQGNMPQQAQAHGLLNNPMLQESMKRRRNRG